MKIRVYGVKWDVDDTKGTKLPSTPTLIVNKEDWQNNNEETIGEIIEEELSNQFGYLHKGWESYEIVKQKKYMIKATEEEMDIIRNAVIEYEERYYETEGQKWQKIINSLIEKLEE